MPLVATRSRDSQEVESFMVSSDEWQLMQRQPLGTFIIPGIDWPAIPKRSIKGLQFFAHAPGFPGSQTNPESEEHRYAKLAVLKALRSAGFSAKVEQSGQTPDGQDWQADVLCHTDQGQIAFEVQCSHQTLDEYRLRTKRYAASGIFAAWLVKAPGNVATLSKALYYEATRANLPIGSRPIFSCSDLALFPMEIGEKNAHSDERMMVAVPSKTLATRIPIECFAVGIATGQLTFNSEWVWQV